jgi:integrase
MASRTEIDTGLPTGIEMHGNSLRIAFSYNNRRYKETLGLPPTKQNIKYARSLREKVIHAIKYGSFNYAEHFPNSKQAKNHFAGGKVGELITLFLKDKSLHVRRSSLTRKEIALRGLAEFHGEHRDVESISPKALMNFKQQLAEDRSGTTINNHITSINSFLKWAHKMDFLPKDYSNILEKVKEAQSNINPFSIDEFIATIANCKNVQHKNMMTVAAYTGMRVGELAALAWEDIDFVNKTILVRRSAYNDRGLKTTKTDTERIIDLLPPALEALESQKALTLNENFPAKIYDIEMPDKSFVQESLRFVFNPKAVRAQKGSDYDYYGHRAFTRIWKSMCEKANVKYRNPYQLRHTYASWLITHANINISYLAKQMGHADITMIAKIYGKWLEEANKVESQRAWDALKKKIGKNLPN